MEDSPNNQLNILNLYSSKEDLSLPGNAAHNNSLNKSVQSIAKPIKRLQSLPLKTFKVTNPQKSEILSIICDNIFEDIIINDDVNLSMIKLKSEINIKNTYNSSKKFVEKAKTISSDKLNIKNEVDEEFDIPPISRPHKKSFIFNNILKIKNIKCPRLLEEQWKYEKILLDYNIIDFTSKKI